MNAEPVTAPTRVTVIIPTRNRPEQVREAIRAVAGQQHDGAVDVVVVFDQVPIDPSLAAEPFGIPVTSLANTRTPGLCGARNTGVLAARGDLVAFCDDDDVWLPGKLASQVAALTAEPEAEFASTSIVIAFDGSQTARLAGRDRVTHADLLRSRMTMLHSSTFLARRQALVERIGLLDETIPGSMCEDWDLLLRASARRPVVHVDRPLVRVAWAPTSFFSRRWEVKRAAHLWMLEHHPDIYTSRIGAGRVLGQIAFDNAALGRRREAVTFALRSLRRNPREHRAVLAVLVALRVVTVTKVLDMLHRHGRGI